MLRGMAASKISTHIIIDSVRRVDSKTQVAALGPKD
jgi:hypothetical protein